MQATMNYERSHVGNVDGTGSGGMAFTVNCSLGSCLRRSLNNPFQASSIAVTWFEVI